MSLYTKQRSSNVIVWILLLWVIFIYGLIYFKYVRYPASFVSPLANDLKLTTTSEVPKSSAQDLKQLLLDIKDFTSIHNGVYSVYVYDLKTRQSAGFGESTIFTAASVNKIPILAALYYEAQSGKVDLDQRITIQADDIQDYGTGILRNEGPGGVYSLKTLAQYMIEHSDNTAAYIIPQVIGGKRIQDLFDSWGLFQTDFNENKTSNSDMATLMVKMYEGKLVNQALTREMIGFMVDSDFENRLPGLLPNDVKVYHKIGTDVGMIHDIGIVGLKNHPYYIGVFSNDINDEGDTEKTIAEVSKMVYDFMSKQ